MNRRISLQTRLRIDKELEKRLSYAGPSLPPIPSSHEDSPVGLSGDAEKTLQGEHAKGTFDLTGLDVHASFESSDETQRVLKWDEAINLEHLIELKNAFENTEKRNEGCFEMDEFIDTFGWILGEGKSTDELSLLFMKIDANSDGTVDWDEFVSFLLSENQQGETIADDKHAKHYLIHDIQDVNPHNSYHREDISCVIAIRLEKLGSRGDRYLTASRDGTIRVWSCSTLRHKATIQTWLVWGDGQNIPGSSPSWITGMIFMPSQQRIAVSSMDRTISFYDAFELKPVYRIRDFENAPLCIHHTVIGQRSLLVFGDDRGNIQYSWSEKGADFDRISFQKLKVHTDWVTKVQYLPELGMFLSCSLDGSMKVTDLEGKIHRSLEGHPKGVNCFDWSGPLKCIASCGLDKVIKLWNPYISKPTVSLVGHVSTVLKVVFNDKLAHIISLSADKQIKVWDAQTYRCIQTIDYKATNWSEEHLNVLAFDDVAGSIIAGGSRLTVMPHQSTRNRQVRSHDAPVVCAMYNNAFHQVVSCDDTGVVRVWDLETGAKVFQYGDTHQGKLNCASYDLSSRRLLTGGSDGYVRLWNFNNGQVLEEYCTRDSSDVAQVFHIPEGNAHRCIVSVGCNRKVIVWREAEDDEDSDEYKRQFSAHSDDIVCADFAAPNFLATGCFDGSIGIWNIESSYLRHTLQPPAIQAKDADIYSVDKIIFLQKKDALLLVASYGDGYLRLWSAREGVLLHEENAYLSEDSAILSLATDHENKWLFAADSFGFIKCWDISELDCASLKSGRKPKPLYTWRGHMQGVNSLDFDNRHSMLISASSDCTIKLWKKDGTLVGIFDQPTGWKLSNPATYSPQQTRLLDLYKYPWTKDMMKRAESISSVQMPKKDAGLRGQVSTCTFNHLLPFPLFSLFLFLLLLIFYLMRIGSPVLG
eukprot:TRINITY_DN4239_c0_g1_i5.p1 TRINITY_DN4239_c0_g1~~TRINITY_DN4239_c0_g1_i5.p1  ORF type:complete len:926 (+),score=164.12 TRINITY_DN4239_c0_g1_i5:48-2825(+)